MYHSCNPVTANTGEECWWDDRVKGPQSTISNSNWQEIITDGSVLNRKWKQWLDEIAVYLQDLKNSGVEVLFRPFHEMNQGVFWWGGRPGPSGTRRLYQISHDYLTNVKRLDNLIWVWNIQDFGSLSNDAQNYNPGPNYFEVVSLDVYEGFQTWKYDVMRNVANGKPIAIGECASLPDASRLANEPLWTFFMSWSELTFEENSSDKITSVYNSQQVITLDEMGDWQSATVPSPSPTPPSPTPPPTTATNKPTSKPTTRKPTTTPTTPTTPTSPTTGSLGDWEQCSSNSQCMNGCCSGMYSDEEQSAENTYLGGELFFDYWGEHSASSGPAPYNDVSTYFILRPHIKLIVSKLKTLNFDCCTVFRTRTFRPKFTRVSVGICCCWLSFVTLSILLGHKHYLVRL